MRRSAKIAMLIASILCFAGVITCAVGLFGMRFDFSKLNTQPIVTNTHEVTEDFAHISIQTNTADVVFAVSEDDNCHVVCNETEKLTHSVTVEGDTLVIKTEDHRKWYDHIGIFFGEISVTVYLPKYQYDHITIETDTGDVEMPGDFQFGETKVKTDTGDVTWRSIVFGSFTLTTDTGDISLKKIAVTKTLKITSHTGDINLDGLEVTKLEIEVDTGKTMVCDCLVGDSISVECNTGDVLLKNTRAQGRLVIETDTGDVKFDRSDAASILVETDTGDVTGTLLSEKIFFTESDTGDIHVPRGTSGGKCEITTDTGDIVIEIVK